MERAPEKKTAKDNIYKKSGALKPILYDSEFTFISMADNDSHDYGRG